MNNGSVKERSFQGTQPLFPSVKFPKRDSHVSQMMTLPPDPYDYDVFVSYRQKDPDRIWVRTRLVPALRKANLRVCVDYESFGLGAPIVAEMGRCVLQSLFTLAVLSPLYLESRFSEIENIMAEHLGLEGGEQRLLLVLREPCQPRLGLRCRLWLDMIDDDVFEEGIARLSETIIAARAKGDLS